MGAGGRYANNNKEFNRNTNTNICPVTPLAHAPVNISCSGTKGVSGTDQTKNDHTKLTLQRSQTVQTAYQTDTAAFTDCSDSLPVAGVAVPCGVWSLDQLTESV